MNISTWVSRYMPFLRAPMEAPVKRQSVMDRAYQSMGYRPGPAIMANEAYKKVGFFYRCVRVLADSAQQVPVFAATWDERSGRMVKLPDSDSLARLIQEPNNEDDFPAILESIFISQQLYGEALLELESAVLGNTKRPPVRMYSHPGRWIQKVDYSGGRYTNFTINTRGFSENIPGDSAAFFRMFNPDDPIRGLAPLAAAYQACDTFYAANLFNARFFESGAVPSLALQFDKDSDIESLTEDEKERIREEISRLHSGLKNAHGVAVLGPGESLKELGTNLKDIFFEALMKFNRAEILATLGVPLILVGEPEGSNRATASEQMRMFWQNTEIPLVEDVSSLFNRKVARKFGQTKAVVFDYQGVSALQKDLKALSDAVCPMVDRGIYLINEFRTDYLNKEPVPWGDGWWHDATLVPAGLGTEAAPPDVPGAKVSPEIASKILKEWKNSTVNRIRSGERTPLGAFQPAREAQKASRSYGIPHRVTWELAKSAFTEIAIRWDSGNPADFVADYFDEHIGTLKTKTKQAVPELSL